MTIKANSTYEYDGQYRVDVTNFYGVGMGIVIDKETYNMLEEYFKHHPKEISIHIAKNKVIEKPIQEDQQMTSEKGNLINDIIGAMLDAGEFHNSGLDVNQKMNDIEYVKRKLMSKSLEQLRWTLSVYTPQQEEDIHNGMHR